MDVKASGGGVFILVKKIYTSSEIKIDTQCELLFVDLKLKDQKNVKIGCFYRPPWSTEEYMEDFQKVLQSIDMQRGNDIWVGGDFNFPGIDWDNMKTLPNNPSSNLSEILLETIGDHLLTQVLNHPTRKDNILDLFFTSNPNLINRTITAPPLTSDTDHDIVFIDINTCASVPKKTPTTKFLYNKADWDAMKKEMSNYILPNTSVQHQWDHLQSFLQNSMKQFIPTKVSRPQKHRPWITRELITDTHRRDRAYAAWKRTKSEEKHQIFLKLRSMCQRKIRKAHKEYLRTIFDSDSSPDGDKTAANKRFWTYIKSKKKDPCSVSPLRSEGVLISDAPGKSNILNNQYCSVFTNEDTTNIPSKGPSQTPDIPAIKVSVNGVKTLLQELKPHKASGPDNISPRVLKELSDPLNKPLAEFFQNSIDAGIVPVQWKKAIVSAIFKKGYKHRAANYRPVSLTAVFSKLCEHIIAKSMMNHLEQHDLLCDNQHGFRRMRSCETQLIQFVDELARHLHKGKQVDVAVMDFSKAFDVVPHKRLLSKLDFYGIWGCTLNWIDAFLSDRIQQVVIDGEFSDVAPVTSDVPQGSVLGPILFLCFINDMPESVSSQCRLFADDSIIYREISIVNDCTSLQHDLDALEKWEGTWGMSFNPSKCNVIHVSRKK